MYKGFSLIVVVLCFFLRTTLAQGAMACNFNAHIEAVHARTNTAIWGFAALKADPTNPAIYFKKTETTGAAFKFDAVGSGSYACISCHIDNRKNKSDTWQFLNGADMPIQTNTTGDVYKHFDQPDRGSIPATNFTCTSVRTGVSSWTDISCDIPTVTASDIISSNLTEANSLLVLSNYIIQSFGSDGSEDVGHTESRSITSREIELDERYALSDFLSTALATVDAMSYPDWTNAVSTGVAERGGTIVAAASIDAPRTQFAATVSKCKYRIPLLGPKGETGIVRWSETFHPLGGGPVQTNYAGEVEVRFTGKRQYLDFGGGQTEREVEPPEKMGRILIEMSPTGGGCMANSCRNPGSGKLKNGCIDAQISLGINEFGEHAGYLLIHEDSPTEVDMHKPSHLKLFANRPGVIIRNGGGDLRQILTAQRLVDIVTNDVGYEIRFYPGAGAVVDGLYEPQGVAEPVWRIENPSAPEIKGDMNIIEIRGGTSKTNYFGLETDFSYYFRPDGLGTEEILTETTFSLRSELRLLKAGATTVYRERKTYSLATPALGDLLTSHTIGDDSSGNGLTTTYSWYTSSSDAHNYGKLQQVSMPGGGWEKYSYTNGRIKRIVRGLQNNTTSSADTDNRVTTYSYFPVDGIDSGLTSTNTPRLIIESNTPIGLEVSRTYIIVATGMVIEARCTAPGASVWDSSNLITTNISRFTNTFEGTINEITFPDHTMEITWTARIVDGVGRTNTVWRGQPNAARTAVTNGTMTVEVINATGQTLSRTSTDIASSIVIARETYGYTSAYSLPASVTTLDGRSVTQTYDCCTLSKTTDKDGVISLFGYDALHRLVTTTRNGLVTSNVLDPAGNIVEEYRHGADGSRIKLGSTSYGLDGRRTSHYDAMTNLTLWSYIKDTNVTTTYPNGGTRIESYYKDGSLQSVKGSAAFPVRYTYGALVNKPYVEEIKLDASGSDTFEGRTTFTDMVGRHFRTKFEFSSQYSYYNDKGQLSQTIDRDGVTNAFEYNGLGELSMEAIDLNGTAGIQTNSTDRIKAIIVDFVNNGNANVRRTRTSLYTTNDTSDVVIVTNEVSVDGMQTWNKQFGLTTSSKIEHSGNTRKETLTFPDGSRNVAFFKNSLLQWRAQYDSLGAEMRRSVIEYDPHERPFLTTDSKNGTTTNSFDLADRVEQVATTSPNANGSSQVVLRQYDNMGNIYRVHLSDGTLIANTYWTNGLLKETSGSRTYPSGFAYDVQGRMVRMTNWTNFATRSGARVTTWSYDSSDGRLEIKTFPDSTYVSYQYTYAGKLSRRTWARGITTDYRYNAAGDLKSIDYSGSTVDVSFAYDRRGRRTGVTNGAMVTVYSLDNAGNNFYESYIGGPLDGFGVTNSFDHFLRRTNIASVGVRSSYRYDAQSRLSEVSDGTNSAAYSYVANSSLVQDVLYKHQGAPRMLAGRSHDRLGRMSEAGAVGAASGPFSYGYNYDAANQRTSRVESDHSNWNFVYDELGQVISGKRRWDNSNTNFVAGQQFEYLFDEIGNRVQSKSGGNVDGSNLRTSDYLVNALNQVTNRTIPDKFDVIGSAASNALVTVNGQSAYRHGEYFRYEFTTNNSSASVYPSVTNHAVLGAGTNTVTGNTFLPKDPEAFAYDADGNQTADGRWAMTWDGENRLVTMIGHSGLPDAARKSITFNYDWVGRRISKVVSNWTGSAWTLSVSNRFLYDGWNLISELSNNVVIRSYVWGSDLSETIRGAGGVGGLLAVRITGAGPQFPVYDGNGSVAALVDSTTGTETATFEYGPFAEPIRVSGPLAKSNPIRFSTKYKDEESGFLYYGYRYYNPQTATWVNRDPLGEDETANLYQFVANNAINYLDSDGRQIFPKYRPPSKLPPPSKPKPINNDVYDKRNWRHSRHEARVELCCCDANLALETVRNHLRAFDLFNGANAGARVNMQDGYLFFEQDGPLGVGSDVSGNEIGVAISLADPGSTYEVEAATQEWHPLIGKRRWGAILEPSILRCTTLLVWTEAYEVPNNMNWVFSKVERGLANTMWLNYLNAIIDEIHCGGLKTGARRLDDEYLKDKYMPW